MYNAATLKAGLINLIGWRQNADAGGTQLTTVGGIDLTDSTSGMYFNDEHPLLTFDSLLSIAPDFTLQYSLPSEINTAFSTWLKEKTEAGIIRAVQTWLDAKFEVKSARNLLERKRIFYTSGRLADTDTNGGRGVGLEVIPRRGDGVKMTIEQIGLQFNTNQNITIRLFHSDTLTHEQTVTVAYAGAGSVQWETVNWTLNGSGAYYVVYDQADLTGESINSARDYRHTIAGATYFPMGRYLQVSAFEVEGDVSQLWDIADNAYTVTTNYGLNLAFNVQCDYTDLIVGQKDLFKTIISKQVAIDLLRELAFNPQARVNRHESNVERNAMLYEIDGDSQGPRPGGLRAQLQAAIDTLSLDLEGLDSVCYPCRRRAVQYRAVWG